MTKMAGMLSTDASLRPTIKDIQERLASTQLVQSIFHEKCCNSDSEKRAVYKNSQAQNVVNHISQGGCAQLTQGFL